MRLFIAIPISENLKKEIKRYQQKLAHLPLHMTPAENMHITLVFLGKTPLSEVPEIEGKIKKTLSIIHNSLFIIPERFALGPDPRRPRLIWLILKASPSLLELQKKLAQALEREEKRAFTAHVTVARKKFDAKLSPQKISVKKFDENLEFLIKEIYLMQSTLGRNGAQYTLVRQFPLPYGYTSWS